MTDSVFIFGASGHAKVVIDALLQLGRTVAFALDDAPAAIGRELLGVKVLGGREALSANRARVTAGVVSIGDNAARMSVAEWLRAQGFALCAVVHPQAVVGRGVKIGDGTVVFAGSVLNADAIIGDNVIVNTGATIDHDCRIAAGVHIAPGCHLCGGVVVGARTFVGAGTTIVPGVKVGADVVIGAGSTVIADVPDGLRVAGTPARALAGARA